MDREEYARGSDSVILGVPRMLAIQGTLFTKCGGEKK